jgi:hypothetical protein
VYIWCSILSNDIISYVLHIAIWPPFIPSVNNFQSLFVAMVLIYLAHGFNVNACLIDMH